MPIGGGKGGKDVRNKIAIIILIFSSNGKYKLECFVYVYTIQYNIINTREMPHFIPLIDL